MDDDRFRLVMQNASGVQVLDDKLFSKLVLRLSQVTRLGCPRFAPGKLVKLVHDIGSLAKLRRSAGWIRRQDG